jgi:hypothetical protein
MSFKEKYLKYKNKYLILKNQYGGFIKTVPNMLEEYTKETFPQFISKLDEYMPLCFYDNKKTNFILINNDNYILINKKLNEDYELYQLDCIFDIKKIDKQHEMIEDNKIIPGINKMINGIHLIQAYNYFSQDIFRKFLSNVWTTGYDFFNRLIDIVYRKDPSGSIGYQKKENIVLSMIFMNKLDYILNILQNLDSLLSVDTTNYHEYKRNYDAVKKKEILINDFNEIKTGILFDYISRNHLIIDDLNINTFDELKSILINKLSNIKSLKFNEQSQIDEFNIMIKIIKIIYTHINENLYLIDQYNYSLFILKYKNFNDIKDEAAKNTNYKSLKTFINNYSRNIIKNKLILNLSCLIYLCYKTNIEIGINYKVSQYILLDYFMGIGKIKNSCIPINQRDVLLKILGIKDSDELRKMPITDAIENKFYQELNSPFKEIKQFTFNNEIKYTDCGETTILNLFNYLLLKEDGSFNLEEADTWDVKLKQFYLKYPTMDSMVDINLYKLKEDLSLVFNNREDQIVYNNKRYKCDINTTMKSIIKTCAVLLNIKTDNFKDILKKINRTVVDTDININDYSLEYKDKFTLDLHEGHGEFNLKLRKTVIPSIEYNLFSHWVNHNIPPIRVSFDWFEYEEIPDKYSLEHFKLYYWYYNQNFFYGFISDVQQTEEICIEAVKTTRKFSPYEIEDDGLDSSYKRVSVKNFIKVVNKTYPICKAAVLSNGDSLKDVPPEMIDIDLCQIAFDDNIKNIEWIPHKFQTKIMLEKIKASGNLELKEKLLTYVNPELL